MNIQIQRIDPEGMGLEGTFPADFIGTAQIDILRFIAPFNVKVKVIRAEDEIVADVVVKSGFESSCSRCLEELKQDWVAEFTLAFDAKEYAEFIEIDEDIRQEIVLNLPVRILCRPDCKGLCIDCGTNLNNKECQHKHAVTNGQ